MSASTIKLTLTDGEGTIIRSEAYDLQPLADAVSAEREKAGKVMAAASLNDSVNELLSLFHYEIRVSLVRLLKTGSTTP